MKDRMKILVCVKQVPAATSAVSVKDGRVIVDARGNKPYSMNRLDENAVEEAVRIKAARPGVVVDAITVGPPRAVDVVKRAIGMGADNGIHVTLKEGAGAGPGETASLIAAVAAGNYDLIIAGAMSEDEGNCRVGQEVAEILDIPCASFAVSVDIREGNKLYVEREITGSTRECLTMTMPGLITVQAGINRPGYPSLSNVLRAERTAIRVIAAQELAGRCGEIRESIFNAELPDSNTDTLTLEGTAEEKAVKLLKILKEKHLL